MLDDIIDQTVANNMKDLKLQNILLRQGSAFVPWLTPIIHTPGPNSYILWQPWLNNYYGVAGPGLKPNMTFVWFARIDQDLNEEMTGRR